MAENTTVFSTNSSNSSISTTRPCPVVLDFKPEDVQSLSPQTTQIWNIICVINGAFALPTFYINLLVVITVLESPRLRSASFNLLLAFLSISDMLTGLLAEPIFIWTLLCLKSGCLSSCDLSVAAIATAMISIGFSLITLMNVSLERYLSVEHPLFYDSKVTSRKLLASVVAGWILLLVGFIFTRFLTTSRSVRDGVESFIVGPGSCIILFCLGKVHLTACRQKKAISAQNAAVNAAELQRKADERKKTMALNFIVIASVIFYCPFMVMKVTGLKSYVFEPISVTFMHLQSLVNPIILSLRLSKIREGVLKKLRLFS